MARPMCWFSRREEFVQWVELLPDTQTPSWLGLPNNAERVLLTTQGECPVPSGRPPLLPGQSPAAQVGLGGCVCASEGVSPHSESISACTRY